MDRTMTCSRIPPRRWATGSVFDIRNDIHAPLYTHAVFRTIPRGTTHVTTKQSLNPSIPQHRSRRWGQYTQWGTARLIKWPSSSTGCRSETMDLAQRRFLNLENGDTGIKEGSRGWKRGPGRDREHEESQKVGKLIKFRWISDSTAGSSSGWRLFHTKSPPVYNGQGEKLSTPACRHDPSPYSIYHQPYQTRRCRENPIPDR